MQLRLHAHGQGIRQNPFGEGLWIKPRAPRNISIFCLRPRRAHQDAIHFRAQCVLAQHVLGPLIIAPIGNDKFNFVMRLQLIDIAPLVAPALATRWALQVHDAYATRVERRNIKRSRSFNERGQAGVAQSAHQINARRLRQRLAASDLN